MITDEYDGKNSQNSTLFYADGLQIRPISEDGLASTLGVYRQLEDFLALGPVPTASMKMVMIDIANSRAHDGIYCGIWDQSGVQIGVLDFCLEADKGATLSLLMISKSYRNRGHGKRIVLCLESYLKRKYGIEEIRSGVQVNNTGGIIFWRKMGFEISNTPMDMGDGTVAYEMRKRI